MSAATEGRALLAAYEHARNNRPTHMVSFNGSPAVEIESVADEGNADYKLTAWLKDSAPAMLDALDAVERVRGLHTPRKSMMSPWVCVKNYGRAWCYGEEACTPDCHFTDDHATICSECHTIWPCATKRALDGDTDD